MKIVKIKFNKEKEKIYCLNEQQYKEFLLCDPNPNQICMIKKN